MTAALLMPRGLKWTDLKIEVLQRQKLQALTLVDTDMQVLEPVALTLPVLYFFQSFYGVVLRKSSFEDSLIQLKFAQAVQDIHKLFFTDSLEGKKCVILTASRLIPHERTHLLKGTFPRTVESARYKRKTFEQRSNSIERVRTAILLRSSGVSNTWENHQISSRR